MASVYILYSKKGDLFYTGYSRDLKVRLDYHRVSEFEGSFTNRFDDWQLYWSIHDLEPGTAVKIERQIKRMKSRVYLKNLKRYPQISERLIQLYK
jgi:putative endonuclease